MKHEYKKPQTEVLDIISTTFMDNMSQTIQEDPDEHVDVKALNRNTNWEEL